MKKIVVISQENTGIVNELKSYLKNVDIVCDSKYNNETCDLVISLDEELDNALNVHYSLLPPYYGENPVQKAILEGVKITGVTLYYSNPLKIIAQYPVFITNDMHYDDLIMYMGQITQVMLPLVVEKLINNEPFEIQNLMARQKCSGCSGCH